MNRNVLLISLQKDLDIISLKILHYQLLKHGFSSHILCIPRVSSITIFDTVCNFVKKLSPLFIGISLMSFEYKLAVQLTRVLKSHFPSITIIWGGIHPTIAPETCLDYSDFVCIGEGDNLIIDFANAISNGSNPDSLGSLAFRRDGKVILNSLYPLITDLSSLPICEHIPRNSYVLHKENILPLNMKYFRKYARYLGTVYSIMTSRGCPFSCTYCCNNALAKIYDAKKIRTRDFFNVIDELKKAVTEYPFIEYISFQDDCFLSRSDDEIEKFCHLYKQEIKRPFIAKSIPIFITDQKMASLKAAGLSWINLGLQSGSDRVCHEVYKRRSGKLDFLKAAHIIKNHDLAAYYDIILDNIFETDKDRIETALTLMETPKPFYTQFLSLILFPGTDLQRQALEQGLINGDEYLNKDELLYNNTSINKLIRLATVIPSSWMRLLLQFYCRKPISPWFNIHLSFARLFAIVFAEPIIYLRVIWLSQRKKLGATIRVLPNYLKEGVSRFLMQFRRHAT